MFSTDPLEMYTKHQLYAVSSNLWCRPATALLIEMYRKYECLWKTTSSHYRNKKKRHEALTEIVTAIAPFRPDTTVEDVKNKINGIRTQYVTEKNKVLSLSKLSGYEPSLWCYDRMSFLAPYTSSMKNKPNNEDTFNSITENVKIEDANHEDNMVESCPNDLEESYSQSELEKVFVTSSMPEASLVDERLPIAAMQGEQKEEDKIASIRCHKESEDMINVFGKFVATQMKLITNRHLLMKLQHTIQNEIMKMQLKQFESDRE